MTATGRAAAIPPPHVGREEVKTVTGMESIRCTGCGRLLLLAGNRAEIRTTLETKCPRSVGARGLFCKARLPGVTMGFVFSGGEGYLWQYTPYQLPGKVTRR